MRKPLFLLLVLSLPLAACTSVAPDPFLTASVHPDAPPISSEVSPEFAVALLPATAGRIRTVRQTARKSYLQQQVVYENATEGFGENTLSVEVGKPSLDAAYLHAPSRRQILGEIREAFPGVAMQIRPVASDNLQGTFGYASGPFGAGGSCIYGWQMVDPNRDSNIVANMAGIDKKFRMQIRLRYCHPGIPEERIGALMEGMRVKSVSPDTMALLEFASGTGQVAIAVPPSVEPAATGKPVVRHRVRAARPADDFGNLDDVVLPITRKTPYAYGQPAVVITPNAQGGVPNAARVPIPVPVIAAPGVDPTVTAAPVKAAFPSPAAVPLPGMVR
nr:cellulose biosynthesis protein BcsN [uncultured Gellertiella sp.]